MNAWEITLEDVQAVLACHGVELPKKQIVEIHGELDHEGIIDSLLNYDDMEQQTRSMLDDIENYLLEAGIVTGEKKFRLEDP
jgi:hypothetical protein